MTLRIVFCGSDCTYSETVLRALLSANVRVEAVWLPGQATPGAKEDLPLQPLLPRNSAASESDPHSLPIVSPFVQRSILNTAWQSGVPTYAVSRLKSQDTAAALRALGVDVGCVACFPRLVPESLLHAARRGFLNVHPSLLPAYRGPSPLFWQFQAGEEHTGVTIHWMDAAFDTGPIAEQRLVPLPDGISETDATILMARAGSRLLTDVLAHVAAGEIPYRQQPPGGSYQPSPTPADFTVSPQWPAHRIFNFMRGVAVWGQPFLLDVAGQHLELGDAVAWSPAGVLAQPVIQHDDAEVTFQCSPGWVRARLMPQ